MFTKTSWYNFHFVNRPLPVTVHLDNADHKFHWRRLHGLQIGDWFIGLIKGGSAK